MSRSLFAVASIVTLPLMLAVAALSSHRAGAQESDGQWAPWIGIPDPSACAGEPVDAEAFVAAIATVAADPALISAIPTQVAGVDELPAGEPATVEEAAGALDTVRAVIACVNTGELGTALSYFSPQGMAQLFLGLGGTAMTFTPEELAQTIEFLRLFIDAPATPVADADRSEILAIVEVRKLPDGQILVISEGSSLTAGSGTAFAVVGEVNGRWLINAFGSIGAPATPPALT